MTHRIYLDGETLFNLYCTELGKPHGTICFYQNEGLIDISVLQWIAGDKAFHGLDIRFPKYLALVDSKYTHN